MNIKALAMKCALICMSLLLHPCLAPGQQYQATDVKRKIILPVPDTVVNALHKLTPIILDSLRWEYSEWEDTPSFLAEFYQHSLEGYAYFDPSGRVQAYLIQVKLNTLPLAALKAVYKEIKIKKKVWLRYPAGVTCAQLEAAIGNSKKWRITRYLSEEEVKTTEYRELFYVYETGRILYPKFR